MQFEPLVDVQVLINGFVRCGIMNNDVLSIMGAYANLFVYCKIKNIIMLVQLNRVDELFYCIIYILISQITIMIFVKLNTNS